jgi:CHASE2 domain-containing sensor protein
MTWINLILILTGLGLVSIIVLGIIVCLLLRLPRFNEFWQSRSFFRNLIVNQVIGLSLLSLIIFLAPIIPHIMELQDATLDIAMEVYSGNIPPRAEKFPAFILLDIDKETHQAWGSPDFTPRDKLTNLIDVAVKAKARLIVVDINVTKATPTNNETSSDDSPQNEETLHEHAQKLVAYLRNYIAQCQTQTDKSKCPPIILIRTFDDTQNSLPKPNISFLEEVGIMQSVPYVQWATARFYAVGEQSPFRRYWKLGQPLCTEDQQPRVIPSVVLLVTALIKKECTQLKMQEALDLIQPQSCNNNSPASLNFCGLNISTDTNFQEVGQRVMYRIPWSNHMNKNGVVIPPKLPYKVYDSQAKPILTILPAESYAESQPQVDLEPLSDSIVIIGGSYDTNDHHVTPIGDMPGALVIINSLHTSLQNLTIKPVSFLTWFGIGFGFILIVTLFSYYLGSGWKYFLGLVGLVLIIVGLFYYSVLLFKDGTWLNVAVPLVIIKIFHVIYQKRQLQEKGAKWLIQTCNKKET